MFENFKEVFSFLGQVEIEGKKVIVEYDQDDKSLRLGGLTLTEASRILSQLTTPGYSVSVKVPETAPVTVLNAPIPESKTKADIEEIVVQVQPDPVEQAERAAIEAEAGTTNYLTPEIKGAATVREVILLLADMGVRDEQKFVSICEQIKPHVAPLAALTHNFEARITRLVTSLDGVLA